MFFCFFCSLEFSGLILLTTELQNMIKTWQSDFYWIVVSLSCFLEEAQGLHEAETHSGVQTPGSAPAYRWTVCWLLHTCCFSLPYTPCCIRSQWCWAPESCGHSSILLQTQDLRTCSLWTQRMKEKNISCVHKTRLVDFSDTSSCCLILPRPIQRNLLHYLMSCNR